MSSRNTNGEKSISEILQSIRNVIDSRPQNRQSSEDELQLTEILVANSVNQDSENVDSDKDSLLSNYSEAKTQAILKDFLETASTLGHHHGMSDNKDNKKSSEIESWIVQLIKPQLKAWLDAHLSDVVKQVVSEEIKILVANIHNNKTL
jgi:cell pole-organizing protein PopZ